MFVRDKFAVEVVHVNEQSAATVNGIKTFVFPQPSCIDSEPGVSADLVNVASFPLIKRPSSFSTILTASYCVWPLTPFG